MYNSYTLSLVVLKFLLIDVRAWSTFSSNLLMSGTQATLGYADTIALGAQKGLEECQSQFTWDKWNCPQSIFTHIFSKNNLPSNREVGYVHAIISAGIVHTVTKNCSMGQFENCKCDTKKIDRSNGSSRSDFRWGGCSDNVEFGFNLAKAFLDEREVGHDPRALINLHNNLVGRMAVRNTMEKICKCHGISGSCTTKTCWMRIAEFKVVGSYLKNAYRKALKFDSNADRDGNSAGRIRRMQRIQRIADSADSNAMPSKSGLSPLLPSTRLAFFEESPDYCKTTYTSFGSSNGTLGRHCSRRRGRDISPDERKSCRKLCRQCGWRVHREKRQVKEPCNCRFEWCCRVQCQQCVSDELTYTCAK